MTETNLQVERYILAGVAGLHLEDQVIAKRCGHLGGKQLVDEETYLARIRAADAARKKVGDIVIIARTDSLQSLGLDVAIDRLKKAVAAGADMVFLEGMTSKEQMERAAKELVSSPFLSQDSLLESHNTGLASSKELVAQSCLCYPRCYPRQSKSRH